MALALVSKWENADLWRCTMATEIPGLDFRVWPNLGDTAQIRMAAFDYNVSPGIFAGMPNLGCIVFLGHGANYFLERPDLPKGVPVMRLKDPGIIAYMTEYVLLYLLSHRRFQATYRQYQAEQRWQEHVPPFPSDVRIALPAESPASCGPRGCGPGPAVLPLLGRRACLPRVRPIAHPGRRCEPV